MLFVVVSVSCGIFRLAVSESGVRFSWREEISGNLKGAYQEYRSYFVKKNRRKLESADRFSSYADIYIACNALFGNRCKDAELYEKY